MNKYDLICEGLSNMEIIDEANKVYLVKEIERVTINDIVFTTNCLLVEGFEFLPVNNYLSMCYIHLDKIRQFKVEFKDGTMSELKQLEECIEYERGC
jgi:hypothetical protein